MATINKQAATLFASLLNQLPAKAKTYQPLVELMNSFAVMYGKKQKNFVVDTNERTRFDFSNNILYFNPNTHQNIAQTLIHELVHAVKQTDLLPSKYSSAQAYSDAKMLQEAEAYYTQYLLAKHLNEPIKHSRFTEAFGGIDFNLGQAIDNLSKKYSGVNLYKQIGNLVNDFAVSHEKLVSYETAYKLQYLTQATTFLQDLHNTIGVEFPNLNNIKEMTLFESALMRSATSTTFGNKTGTNANDIITIKSEGSQVAQDAKELSLSNDIGFSIYAFFDLAYGGKGNDTIKGSNFNDMLLGGDDMDTLIGNDGNDVLAGNAGKDNLQGGKGYDAYIADSLDTINDSDGQGKVYLDRADKQLTGGNLVNKAQGLYKDANGTTYAWNQKAKTLTINGGLVIQNFTNGVLGITLKDKAVATRSAMVSEATIARSVAAANNLINSMSAFGSDSSVASFANTDPYANNLPQLAVAV